MKYQIFKETTPKNTVSTIKKILKRIGINTTELITKHTQKKLYCPHSLHLHVKGNYNCGTNGKGTSLINAKASAYAEFIERLQNRILISFNPKNYIFSPDEKIIDSCDLNKNCFNNYIADEKLLNLINELANRLCLSRTNFNKSVLVPFYSYKEKKAVNLPILILKAMQTSNGMAAGNTIEEALVQALSEISERFALKKVINENIVLPDIPQEEYMKYTKIKGLIKTYEENDYEISIKDASLGMDIPAVCIVFYDKKLDLISLNFGSHPSLPVSIERCLTEFVQGTDITKKERSILPSLFISKESLESNIKNKNLNLISEKHTYHVVYMQNCNYLQEQFFKRKSKHKFSRSAWIPENIEMNNEKLLIFLFNNIKKYTDDIYVRDVSFLGFPSVYIFIPKMSFFMNYDIKRVQDKLKLYDWLHSDITEYNITVNDLFELLFHRKNSVGQEDLKITSLPNEYILLLCSIILNDNKNIEKFANVFIDGGKYIRLYKKDFITRISIIRDFYRLKSKNSDENLIIKKLSKNYSEKDIKLFKIFIKNLSFRIIKKIVLQHIESKEQIDKKNENTDIINKLCQEYEKNVIDQTKLASIFDF